jgi:hypothetical protein
MVVKFLTTMDQNVVVNGIPEFPKCRPLTTIWRLIILERILTTSGG